MVSAIPQDWLEVMGDFISQAETAEIINSSLELRKTGVVYPPEDMVFNALKLTPYRSVRAVILGQDPYFCEGQAHGLAFSVPDGVKIPPTLRNIFKEYSADLCRPVPTSGDLTNWALNGVLLLNTILTVQAGKPESHLHLNWQKLTNAVVSAVALKKERVTFILWGRHAIEKAKNIPEHHRVITSPHPSPLAAYRGFFGSKPFSSAQSADWQWPEL